MESPRNAFRRAVRERSFAIATEHLRTKPWDQLRIGHLAVEVGVSRPTIYAEFGSKEGFGEALVLHEVSRVLAGIQVILDEDAARPAKSLEKAAEFALDEANRSPVVRSILSMGAGSPNDDRSLLPFVTTRARPMMLTASESLYEWFKVHSPSLSKRDLLESVDSFVRLAISHMLSPENVEQTPAKLARAAKKLFPDLANSK